VSAFVASSDRCDESEPQATFALISLLGLESNVEVEMNQIIGPPFKSRAKHIRRSAIITSLFVFALVAILFTREQSAARTVVTLTEFSDFQCPYCKRAAGVVEQVRQTYGERVKVVFKQMPLPMHQQVFKVAQASVCAQDQGKFWEYHDRVFAASD